MNCRQLVLPAVRDAFESAATVSEDGDDCEITVPFERVDRDAITVWIGETQDGYRITDRGETYGMLYLSNVDLGQDRRRRRLQSIAQRYDLEEAKYEVTLEADESELGARVIDAIQAIQSISHLLFTRQQYTVTDFVDDVGSVVSEAGYEFTQNATVEGTSDDHRVDFRVSTRRPTLIDALHAENISTAHTMAQRTGFKWTDIRDEDSQYLLVSVVDDVSGEYDDRTERILAEYADELVHWSRRDRLQTVLDGGGPGSQASAD